METSINAWGYGSVWYSDRLILSLHVSFSCSCATHQMSWSCTTNHFLRRLNLSSNFETLSVYKNLGDTIKYLLGVLNT